MKNLNQLLLVVFGIGTVLALTACPKTKNGTNTSSNASCEVRSDGTVRDDDGDLCSSGSAICPQNGYYRNESNQEVSCEPGERIYIDNNYPYGTNPTQGDGCRQWTQMYHTLYIPMRLNAQIVCVKYSWLNQYAQVGGSSCTNQPQCYYQYPPYQQGQHQCGNPVPVNYNSSVVKICFNSDYNNNNDDD